MKKRLVILTIILGISLSGCSQKEANTEPTEAVIETEEKIVETETEEETEEVIETETEEPLEIADETYPGFSSENITINSDGKVTDYNEAFIKECRNYHMFDECNDEEVKEVLQSVIEEAIGSSERTPSLYHAISSMDESGVNGREFLSSGTSSSKDNSSTSGNKSNSNSNSNSNSASTSNNTQSNSNASTPSQDTDTTKGYGDAGGGNNNSEAPVQEIDDGLGSNAEEVANLWGQHQWSESDGSSIDLH